MRILEFMGSLIPFIRGCCLLQNNLRKNRVESVKSSKKHWRRIRDTDLYYVDIPWYPHPSIRANDRVVVWFRCWRFYGLVQLKIMSPLLRPYIPRRHYSLQVLHPPYLLDGQSTLMHSVLQQQSQSPYLASFEVSSPASFTTGMSSRH